MTSTKHKEKQNNNTDARSLTDNEHVLLRPDMYVGDVQLKQQNMWVVTPTGSHEDDDDENEDNNNDNTDKKNKKKIERCGRIIQKELNFSWALLKIFDEVLINASDQHQQYPTSCNTIKVDVDQNTGKISVHNNGPGVNIDIHKTSKIPNLTMIFGRFRTGTNFDDDVKRTWGGRNGLGVKLTNVFSSDFIVETVNAKHKQKFIQKWHSNMNVCCEPIVTPLRACEPSEEYTKVSFVPDYPKFGMSKLTNDMVELFKKRVYDLAGIMPSLRMYWNGDRIKMKDGFSDYCNMYMSNELIQQRFEYSDKNGCWDVVVAFNPDEEFRQISFVNGLNTMDGGTHVDHVLDQVIPHLIEGIRSIIKDKAVKVTPSVLKSSLSVFVNAFVPNPTFNTQTKVRLETPPKEFIPPLHLTDAAIKKLKSKIEGGLAQRLSEVIEVRNGGRLAKSDKTMTSRTKIPKLQDALHAGKKDWEKCTMIFTEGDSAKSLIMAGLSVIGTEYYGVFPLRGKIINVRDAALSKIEQNKEFTAIKAILGLRNRKDAIQKLRYGRVMIASDADSDGHHICALFANCIHRFWPEQLRQRGEYLSIFRTPIIKVWQKHKGGHLLKDGAQWFYSQQEYDTWKLQHPDADKFYEHKYYKGLGTSSPAEGKEYFELLSKHRIPFLYGGENDDKRFEMIFSKHCANQRKHWIEERMKAMAQAGAPETLRAKMTYQQFFDEQLITHSTENCERTLPSMMDGLKPAQRKILQLALKTNLVRDTKVASLCGSVLSKMAYHHGDASLQHSIVLMAQDYVGSNNINLFHPSGQFGTRAEGGSDYAQARYISTRLMPIVRLLFRQEDDAILKLKIDDGVPVEPHFFLPVLPLLLINGTSGIGTGWASNVPSCHPITVLQGVRKFLSRSSSSSLTTIKKETNDKETEREKEKEKEKETICVPSKLTIPESPLVSPLVVKKVKTTKSTSTESKRIILPRDVLQPFYRGFQGSVEYDTEHARYWVCGKYTVKDDKQCIIVHEIPVSTSYTKYQEHLDKLVLNNKIQNYNANINGHDKFEFVLHMTSEQCNHIESRNFADLKLMSTCSIQNMVAYNEHGVLMAYKTLDEILEMFCQARLPYYQKRKDHLLNELHDECILVTNKARFTKMIVDGDLTLANVEESLVYDVLVQNKFDMIIHRKRVNNNDNNHHNNNTEDANVTTTAHVDPRRAGFHYLTSIPLLHLTTSYYMRLQKQQKVMQTQIQNMEALSPKQIWLQDLAELEPQLLKVLNLHVHESRATPPSPSPFVSNETTTKQHHKQQQKKRKAPNISVSTGAKRQKR